MRSFFAHLRIPAVFRRAAVVLVALAVIGLASSCHRNDLGSEFRTAAAKGDLTKVQALFKVHPDLVFSKNKSGRTALYGAAAYGRRDVADFLLSNKADVNARDKYGITPLHSAVSNGHKDLTESLLAHAADANAKGHADVADLLREHGGHDLGSNFFQQGMELSVSSYISGNRWPRKQMQVLRLRFAARRMTDELKSRSVGASCAHGGG